MSQSHAPPKQSENDGTKGNSKYTMNTGKIQQHHPNTGTHGGDKHGSPPLIPGKSNKDTIMTEEKKEESSHQQSKSMTTLHHFQHYSGICDTFHVKEESVDLKKKMNDYKLLRNVGTIFIELKKEDIDGGYIAERLCSGTLLYNNGQTPNTVITAAHCVLDFYPFKTGIAIDSWEYFGSKMVWDKAQHEFVLSEYFVNSGLSRVLFCLDEVRIQLKLYEVDKSKCVQIREAEFLPSYYDVLTRFNEKVKDETESDRRCYHEIWISMKAWNLLSTEERKGKIGQDLSRRVKKCTVDNEKTAANSLLFYRYFYTTKYGKPQWPDIAYLWFDTSKEPHWVSKAATKECQWYGIKEGDGKIKGMDQEMINKIRNPQTTGKRQFDELDTRRRCMHGHGKSIITMSYTINA